MTFFTLGNHHDFAVTAIGDDALEAPENSLGLQHIAFKIGTQIQELRDAKARIEAAGLKVVARDHKITQSIYFNDPDGNTIELYVDTSDIWKEHPEAVAQSAPLEL
ncbi:MAG: VOC family protein [Methylobacter sp.]